MANGDRQRVREGCDLQAGYCARLCGLVPLAGVKTCLYFSILDLRGDIRPYCVTRENIDRVKAQLTELLTNYGEITALVIDGWNAAWSRLNYEEMPFLEIYNHLKQLQPNCLVSDYNQGRFPAPALYYTDVKLSLIHI